jgi:hypothetical protein
LGGPVGRESLIIWAPRGSDAGFGVRRGEEKGGNSQVTEGWRSMWICVSVYKDIYRIVGKRSKLYAPQPDGPSGGAGGYLYLYLYSLRRPD